MDNQEEKKPLNVDEVCEKSVDEMTPEELKLVSQELICGIRLEHDHLEHIIEQGEQISCPENAIKMASIPHDELKHIASLLRDSMSMLMGSNKITSDDMTAYMLPWLAERERELKQEDEEDHTAALAARRQAVVDQLQMARETLAGVPDDHPKKAAGLRLIDLIESKTQEIDANLAELLGLNASGSESSQSGT